MSDKLKQRLATLRRQTGQAQATPRFSVAERVERYAVRGRDAGPLNDRAAADCVNGTVLTPGVVVMERRAACVDRHGHMALTSLYEPCAHLPEAASVDPRRVVFLDTETTGLAGGTGTAVFLLGLARLEDHGLTVRQYLLTGFAGEGALLEAAADWLDDADALVTFNGKRFDVPLLTTRCRLAGVADRYARRPHMDLLYPLRRAFARQWEDCRLVTAERRLLGFARANDLPGFEAPAAWLQFLRAGDPALLPRVAQHNYWDLLSLAVLLPALDRAHGAPAHWNADVGAVARAHVSRDAGDRALALLHEARHRLDDEERLLLANLYRLHGQWGEAVGLWRELAETGNLEALERLAKYYEHTRRDYAVALAYARRLPQEPQHRHRCARLQAKLNTRTGTDLFLRENNSVPV